MLETGTAPAEKGGTRPVQLYGYTMDGQLLACLVESFDLNKREKAYNDGYEIIHTILNVEPKASYEIFHSSLYKKYKDRGVFGEFIMDPLRQSLESYSEIKTMNELRYSTLIFLHTSDAAKGNLYLDLWNVAFREMNPLVQELLLFNMKMEIEQRMMHRAMVPHLYEKFRLELVYLSTMLAMEGYCKNCNIGQPVTLKVTEYHERTNFLPNDPIMHECPKCKKKSLHIPTL